MDSDSNAIEGNKRVYVVTRKMNLIVGNILFLFCVFAFLLDVSAKIKSKQIKSARKIQKQTCGT